jgi:hypothetical protein
MFCSCHGRFVRFCFDLERKPPTEERLLEQCHWRIYWWLHDRSHPYGSLERWNMHLLTITQDEPCLRSLATAVDSQSSPSHSITPTPRYPDKRTTRQLTRWTGKRSCGRTGGGQLRRPLQSWERAGVNLLVNRRKVYS